MDSCRKKSDSQRKPRLSSTACHPLCSYDGIDKTNSRLTMNTWERKQHQIIKIYNNNSSMIISNSITMAEINSTV